MNYVEPRIKNAIRQIENKLQFCEQYTISKPMQLFISIVSL